jgi:hypothetical protein
MRDCLVPNGDSKKLAKKMQSFYSHPPQMNSKNLNRFEACHIAKKYLELIF